MKFQNTAIAILIFACTPAWALVVADENFDDDIIPPNAIALNGPPSNNGRPGNWIPNQYHLLPWFNNPWHDELDATPDTNWQLMVTQDIGPDRPGNEAFFRNIHTNCPLYMHCQFIQDDCSSLGLTTPGHCDNDRFDRDGFMQFTLADGTPRPAMPGEKLIVSFDFTSFDGIAAFALTNDVQQMAEDTSDENLHPPLTKWQVGFGQSFNAMDEGLLAWHGGPRGKQDPQHPNAVSLLTFAEGFNGRAFDVWTPADPADLSLGQQVINLDPDFIYGSKTADPGNEPPYQTLRLEYTVGNSTYDLVTIDFNDGHGPQEVRQGLEEEIHGTGPPPDPGGPIPIGQQRLLDAAQNPSGPNYIDGLVFSDTGEKMASYMIDNICIVINGTLDECGTGSPVLLGDANKDGQVTGADLIAVQQNFGNVGSSPLQGDANNDSQVTGGDLIAVQQNFGNVTAMAVPEPVMLSVFLVLLLSQRGRGAIRRQTRTLLDKGEQP